MRARRLIPAQREWAVNYALSDAEGFAKFVASQPRYLGENRASSLAGAPAGAEPALMASELRVCSQLGIKPEDFVAAKKARLGAAAAI
jgi:hypothetical protein